MATRLAKLLKSTGAGNEAVCVTGGLALDPGLIAALREELADQKISAAVSSHPDSIYAGAIGAALWGAFRHQKLARLAELPLAS